MPKQRYQFRGQNVEQPSVPQGSQLGSLLTQLNNLEANAMNKRWQLEDEKIQLEVLKGGDPASLVQRYKDLAEQAGAFGDELASVGFLQKAEMLVSRSSSGGGGGSGSGSGDTVTASEGQASQFDDEYNAIVIDSANEKFSDINQLLDATITGEIEITNEDGSTVVIPIEPNVAAERANALYSEYGEELRELHDRYAVMWTGGKDGKPVTGWKSKLDAINKELDINVEADKDGKGKRLIESAFGRFSGVSPNEGLSDRQKFQSEVLPLIVDVNAPADENGIRPQNPNGVLALLPQEVDPTTNLPKEGFGLQNFVWQDRTLLEAQGYSPLDIAFDNGSVSQIYALPTNQDDLVDPEKDVTDAIFTIPNFDENFKFAGFTDVVRKADNKFYFPNSDQPIAEEGEVPLIGSDKALTTLQGLQEEQARQDLPIQEKVRRNVLGDVVAKRFQLDPESQQQQVVPEADPSIQELETDPARKSLLDILSPQAHDPEFSLLSEGPQSQAPLSRRGTIQDQLSLVDLLRTPQPEEQEQVRRDTFADILNQRFGTENIGQEQQAAPTYEQQPAPPPKEFTRESDTGITRGRVGGGIVRVNKEKDRLNNPLNIRSQASLAALKGFKSFSNLLRGLF